MDLGSHFSEYSVQRPGISSISIIGPRLREITSQPTRSGIVAQCGVAVSRDRSGQAVDRRDFGLHSISRTFQDRSCANYLPYGFRVYGPPKEVTENVECGSRQRSGNPAMVIPILPIHRTTGPVAAVPTEILERTSL